MPTRRLSFCAIFTIGVSLLLPVASPVTRAVRGEEIAGVEPAPWPLNVEPVHVSKDESVNYDYPIVYVRAPRTIQRGDRNVDSAWPEFGHPTRIDAGYDLMLLRPDGSEEVLVEGGRGSITDPFVSFDGESVYYAYHHDPDAGEWTAGADIYRIHVPTRKITRLTHQRLTPNTGVADWSADFRSREPGKTNLEYGVYNLGPCPLPGGRVMFVSNRDGVNTPRGYPRHALQLFTMDDDGNNVEKIGHLNVAGALHPVILKDGRVLFSTLESQGARGGIQWGVWSIHPDGTNWESIISAYHRANGFHFQSQLSDGTIVIENYYNQNNRGFGTHLRLPLARPGEPAFGPGATSLENDPRMRMLSNERWGSLRLPFLPRGLEVITHFATFSDRSASLSDPDNPASTRVGKVTHPAGAPDNHLLTVWTAGATPNANGPVREPIHAGIYLIKEGRPIDEPGQMLKIKHDKQYNTHWPRALVSYERIYGVKEPRRIEPVANNGQSTAHLGAGSPFGLIGTSSFYKRESYPAGVVPAGSVTATYTSQAHLLASFMTMNAYGNWNVQGSDAGLYDNSDIHAVRIVAMEPATTPVANRFYNFANERLRVLGEIPLRKFGHKPGAFGARQDGQPLDPDGNPDTSFLAKIPADVAFTFQTLDKHGMVLNMAQTWHQVRPGEVRHNCGGCHSHSQAPTRFEETVAARDDYKVWDLTSRTPLLASKAGDETGSQWDVSQETGVKFSQAAVHDVEYWRDVQPIFTRSCVACHAKGAEQPAGDLALDADDEQLQVGALFRDFPGDPPGTYFRLAMDNGRRRAADNLPQFGPPIKGGGYYRFPLASRYIAKFQARRSLLVWKIYGRRTDGLPDELQTAAAAERYPQLLIDYNPSVMPPPAAVKSGKVQPLSDEDRRTIVRWIDLGCPIDLAYDPAHPERRGDGWLLDDQRPTLTMTEPAAGANSHFDRILIGMHDYNTGLDMDSVSLTADFPIAGQQPGSNLADRMQPSSPGVWELKLDKPITSLARGTIKVSVKDRQGNITSIERTFSIE